MKYIINKQELLLTPREDKIVIFLPDGEEIAALVIDKPDENQTYFYLTFQPVKNIKSITVEAKDTILVHN